MDPNNTRPLLILDLDETLIHASENGIGRSPDFRACGYQVFRRPGLQEFLLAVAELFELAVWSSASEDYVQIMTNTIRPDSVNWHFVWGRNRCTRRYDPERMTQFYLKNLKKLKLRGYDLTRILVVDDSWKKHTKNYGNAIYVNSFEGDPNDNELQLLLVYLRSIVNVENYRRLEKRRWRQVASDLLQEGS
ncbi:MAG: NIF family HAD-type phosphatase [Planctomycetota bacterium]